MKTWSLIKRCKACGREYIGPQCDNKFPTCTGKKEKDVKDNHADD